MNPNERTLELDKILELLANEAANDLTREQARHLQPQTDLAVVQAELEKTDSALALAVQFGTPPFRICALLYSVPNPEQNSPSKTCWKSHAFCDRYRH